MVLLLHADALLDLVIREWLFWLFELRLTQLRPPHLRQFGVRAGVLVGDSEMDVVLPLQRLRTHFIIALLEFADH